MPRLSYGPSLTRKPPLTFGDGLIFVGLSTLLYAGILLAWHAPAVIRGPEISLSLGALPWYSLLSLGRMTAAYILSLAFSLTYGYIAARSRKAEKVMMPLLDVLQSVPILSFLPVVLLSFTAFLPKAIAPELAAIVLIFTSQVWNMTFSFYQSVTTVPNELREASTIFDLHPWLRLRTLDLPFAALPLVWNSMMSWSGGWFFLMAAEIFHVGSRDFRLPGLGSYLQTAANAGNSHAILAGLFALILIILLLDQLIWRPLLAWADKFKVEMVQGSEPPRSWFYDLLSRSYLVDQLDKHVLSPAGEWLDGRMRAHWRPRVMPGGTATEEHRQTWFLVVALVLLASAGAYGTFRTVHLLAGLPVSAWARIGVGTLATFVRVTVALLITLLWTLPVGVAIGMNRRLAELLQPVVQVVASIPATAIFPILLLALLNAPGGLNVVSTLLMLMGTQWYLLFNIIAGASAIPQDLRDTTELLGLSRWERWRTLILPALFPYIITGSITASGGAWNASIVAEHVIFGGHAHDTIGVGALIAQATNDADYALLLASTLALVMTVVLLNRRFWRRLYRIAEDRYRME
jgi:NitT/TauT family transport system permease protein